MMKRKRSNVTTKAKVVTRKKPRTIQEKLAMREVFVFNKSDGTLKCYEKGLEIKSVSFGASRPGEKVRHYKVPFTESQAREICNAFDHIFVRR